MTELEDRARIVDLISTYARAVDTKDWDLYESLFAPDALIDYTSSGGIRGTPRQVRDWVAGALSPFTMTQHLVTNHLVEIDGEVARAHSDFYNPMGRPDAEGEMSLFFVGGSYHDSFARSGQGWLFTERIEEMLWVSNGPPGLRLR